MYRKEYNYNVTNKKLEMETIKNYVENIINNMKNNNRLFELVSKDSNRMKQQVLVNVKSVVKSGELRLTEEDKKDSNVLSTDEIEYVYSLVDEIVYSK